MIYRNNIFSQNIKHTEGEMKAYMGIMPDHRTKMPFIFLSINSRIMTSYGMIIFA